MSFGTSPASPFTAFTSKFTSAWGNFVRACLASAVDGDGGGTYNLMSGTTLWFPSGGGNIIFDAAFAMSAATVPSGGSLTIASNATQTVSGTLVVPIGGLISVTTSGSIQIGSAAGLTVEPGGSITLTGTGGGSPIPATLNVGQACALNVNGAAGTGNGATLTIGQYGTLEISASGGTLVVHTGAVFDVGADMLRTGADKPSGAGAYSVKRQTTFSGTTTIANPAAYDTIVCTQSSGPNTVTLAMLGGTPAGVRVRVVMPGSNSGFTTGGALSVKDGTSATVLGTVNNGGGSVATTTYADVESMLVSSTMQWVLVALG